MPLTKEAFAGSAVAMMQLSAIYRTTDPLAAAFWASRAVAAPSPLPCALSLMAHLCKHGLGVPQDAAASAAFSARALRASEGQGEAAPSSRLGGGGGVSGAPPPGDKGAPAQPPPVQIKRGRSKAVGGEENPAKRATVVSVWGCGGFCAFPWATGHSFHPPSPTPALSCGGLVRGGQSGIAPADCGVQFLLAHGQRV